MPQAAESQTLDAAFKALETYTRGDDPKVLVSIEHAVQQAHGDQAARAALEQRLSAQLLRSSSSEAARKFICRELAVIGSAASVPALAALLPDESLSHMARYALERIPGSEADTALRDALGKTKGATRIGIIHSIGARRDARSVTPLAKLLANEPASAAAAAKALGEIGTPEAVGALQAFRGQAGDALRLALADALLIGAERLVASGDRARAVKLLESLSEPSQAPHVRLAARRALSAARRPR